MNKYKVVCFDLDGTLIRNTDSVRFLCSLNGKEKESILIDKEEKEGKFDWIEADYKKAELIKGLTVSKISEQFGNIKIIDNLDKLINYLKDNNYLVILNTAGPIQVAEEMKKIYNFDEVFGSLYEVENNYFTGKILNHAGSEGKLNYLKGFCKERVIKLSECISIGDSASDIDLFKYSGKAIAINYNKSVIGFADEYIITENVHDLVKFL